MTGIFMLAVAGLTSAAAYLLGVRPLGLAPAQLGVALGKMLEMVGAILIFLVGDLLVAGGPRHVRVGLPDGRHRVAGPRPAPGPGVSMVAGGVGEAGGGPSA